MSATIAAAAVAAALIAGVLLAARPALAAAALGAACYLPLVMTSVVLGIALWIPVLFAKGIPNLAASWMLLLICAAWAGSLVAGRSTLGRLMPGQRMLVGGLGLLLAWLSLSVLWAGEQQAAWSALFEWFSAAAVLIVVATTIGNPAQLRLILLAFTLSAVLSVIVGLAGLGPPVGEGGRLQGAEDDPNYFAMLLPPAIVFAAALAFDTGRAALRWALLACAVLLAIALALTQSRGGLIAAGVVVLAAAVIFRNRWTAALLGAVAVGAAAVGIWLALGPGMPSGVRLDEGGGGRSTLWLVAWRASKDYPIEGVGLNNFRPVSPGYIRQPGRLTEVDKVADEPHVVHNTFLELLVETGVVGLGLFLAVVAACLAAAARAARTFERLGRRDLARLARAVLLASVGFLAAQVFLSAGSNLRFWVVLALGPAVWTIAQRMATRAPA